jgi:hypothetical protein
MRRRSMHSRGPNFFSLGGGRGREDFSFFPLLPMCSQENFKGFSSTSKCVLQVSNLFPQHIPYGTSLWSHMLWHMLSSFTSTSMACAVGPLMNLLWNRVNSTYEHCCARSISDFGRVKYERKSYLKLHDKQCFLSVNTLFIWFFLSKSEFLIYLNWMIKITQNSIYHAY